MEETQEGSGKVVGGNGTNIMINSEEMKSLENMTSLGIQSHGIICGIEHQTGSFGARVQVNQKLALGLGKTF